MNSVHPTTVMNFLNEVAEEFPSAISLAAGRPIDRFVERLDPGALLDALVRYEQCAARDRGLPDARALLLQYGRTAGLIHDLVAQQLRNDEKVAAMADRILITAGCQEALALCLAALCPDPADVALVPNPTYIGATGAACAGGVAVFPVPNVGSDFAQGIEQAVSQLHQSGRRVRALYLIPTFDNPTGRVIDEVQRRAILEICARLRIVILEDNPYGMFRYEGESILPMAALDGAGCVIYLSTFSKTIAPAVRVGAATLPETLFGDRAASTALWKDLVQRKSYLTVNTSQITQAIVGGFLLEQNGSLQQWIQPALAWYRDNRDAMLDQLQAVFPQVSGQIRWNRPSGGFFLTVDLPFQFNAESVVECATDYGVIAMPMSFFALDSSQDHRLRLSFSAVDAQQIRSGISSLARYLEYRLGRRTPVCEAVHASSQT
jgi:(S)-3,5-dihydroxyphenylglycine transaminase